MKFYYENYMGNAGYFCERNLIKAIYTAWNIDADLYLIEDNKNNMVFAPNEDNELNSELLKEYGYYMTDGLEEREIRKIGTDKLVRYDWSEVKQLV